MLNRRATSKHVREGMVTCLLFHGWAGQEFSLTVTLKPAEASFPGLDTAR